MRALHAPYWLLQLSLEDCVKDACALARSLLDHSLL
jgi:hypothetical protein